MTTKLGRCECVSDDQEHLRLHADGLIHPEGKRCSAAAVRMVTVLRDPAKAERVLADVRGFLRYDDYKQVALCAACADFHEGNQTPARAGAGAAIMADVHAATALPISAPASTLEDLYNDLAALDVARRAVAIIREIGGETLSLLEANGAGVYDSRATLVCLAEKIAETENTIDALEGAGPPLEPVTSVTVCDVCNVPKPRDTVRLIVVAGSETWACYDCREAGQP